MRKIPVIPAILIVSIWVFSLGFALGYLSELEAGAPSAATGAGLSSGVLALVLGAGVYLVVRLVRAVAHARRAGDDAKLAG